MEGLESKLEYGLLSRKASSFKKYCDNFDYIILTETWGKPDSNFEQYFHNFDIFTTIRTPKDSSRKGYGGILFGRKTNLKGKAEKLDSVSKNLMWVLLTGCLSEGEKLLVCIVYYSPPGSSEHSDEPLFEIIYEEASRYKLQHNVHFLLLCGDLNARTGTLPDTDLDDEQEYNEYMPLTDLPINPRANRDTTITVRGRELVALCRVMKIRILNGRSGKDQGVGEFTCINWNGRSLNDYAILSEDLTNSVIDFEIGSRTESNHFPVTFSLQTSLYESENDLGITNVTEYQRLRWNGNLATDFNVRLESENVKEMIRTCKFSLEGNDPQVALLTLYEIIWFCGEKMKVRAYSKSPSNRDNDEDWFDEHCENLKYIARRLKSHFRSTGDPDDYDEFRLARNEFNNVKSAKRSSYQASQRSLLVDSLTCSDQKKFWNLLKSRFVRDTNNLVSPTAWFQYFENLYASFGTPSVNEIENGELVTEPVLDDKFDIDELTKGLRKLKCGKSAGIDGIPNEFWKFAEPLFPLLLDFMNQLYVNGFYPVDWQTGIIVPIFKKGDPSLPDNYRGIALLCCIAKLLAFLLSVRLKIWASLHDFWSPFQSGFREKHSTIDNIFVIYSAYVCNVQRSSKPLYCAYIDFRKCFDSLDRSLIWKKLQSYGLSTQMLTMLKAMFSEVQACVKSGSNKITEHFDCPFGVRQGCVLSPLIFIMYVNDLARYLKENGATFVPVGVLQLLLLLFADDLALFDRTARGLQVKLKILARYCCEFGLQVNLEKSNIMVMRPRNSRREIVDHWYFNGEEMKLCDEYTYLGVQLASSMSWDKAKGRNIDKARKALFAIYGNLKKFGRVSPRVLLKIFDSKVVPILLYGCELWGFSDLSGIESVANNFYRRLLSLANNSTLALCRGELGRYPLKVIIQVKIVKYWIKLLSAEDSTPARRCYLALYSLAESENPVDCWALKVKQMLNSFNVDFLTDAWQNQDVGRVNTFVRQFRENCIRVETESWLHQVSTFGMLRFYRVFKAELKYEPYLDLDIKDRQLFTRLRGGLLRIACNEGRWTVPSVPLADRICPLCNSQAIEDEVHFVFQCRATSSFRRPLLAKYEMFRSENVTALMCSDDPRVIRDLCRFIKSALEFRAEVCSL